MASPTAGVVLKKLCWGKVNASDFILGFGLGVFCVCAVVLTPEQHYTGHYIYIDGNHRINQVGRDLQDHPVQPITHQRVISLDQKLKLPLGSSQPFQKPQEAQIRHYNYTQTPHMGPNTLRPEGDTQIRALVPGPRQVIPSGQNWWGKRKGEIKVGCHQGTAMRMFQFLRYKRPACFNT